MESCRKVAEQLMGSPNSPVSTSTGRPQPEVIRDELGQVESSCQVKPRRPWELVFINQDGGRQLSLLLKSSIQFPLLINVAKMVQMKVVKCPSDKLSLSNCLVVNENDFSPDRVK